MLLLFLFSVALFVVQSFATTPKISYILPFGANQVTIHFDTDANRTYELQYTDCLGCLTNGGTAWSNLVTFPADSVPNHYVWPDTRTRPSRFYRLRVTP